MSDEQVQDVSPGEAEDVIEAADDGAELETETEGEGREEKRVPVSESIRYRRRAQAAEQKLEALQAELAATRESLSESEQALADAERRQRIDQLLSESEAIDVEAARLLTEVAVTQMEEPDVAAAVEELRSRKPYLFRQHGGGTGAGGSMSARRRGGAGSQLTEAAEAAATTGQRQDLLRYLRMRRGVRQV
ncbi:MAG: hypothetical protein WD294_10405 [Phycisphaeraceae bacterium]